MRIEDYKIVVGKYNNRFSVKLGRKTIGRFYKSLSEEIDTIAIGTSKELSYTTEYNMYGCWTKQRALELIVEAYENNKKFINEGTRDFKEFVLTKKNGVIK